MSESTAVTPAEEAEFTFEQLREMARLPLLPAHLPDYYAAVRQLFAVLTERAAPVPADVPLQFSLDTKLLNDKLRDAEFDDQQMRVIQILISQCLRPTVAREGISEAAVWDEAVNIVVSLNLGAGLTYRIKSALEAARDRKGATK